MDGLPFVDVTPGLYQVLTTADTDYPVAIPTDDDGTPARALVLWFTVSAADRTATWGRVAFDKDGTAISGLAETDTLLGNQPDVPVRYDLAVVGDFGADLDRLPTHVHLSSPVAGVVARGMWLFGR